MCIRDSYGPSTGSKGRKKRSPNRPRNATDQNSGIHDLPNVTLPVGGAPEQIADGFEIFEVPEKAHVETAASAVQGAKRRPSRMPVWIPHVERALLPASFHLYNGESSEPLSKGTLEDLARHRENTVVILRPALSAGRRTYATCWLHRARHPSNRAFAKGWEGCGA